MASTSTGSAALPKKKNAAVILGKLQRASLPSSAAARALKRRLSDGSIEEYTSKRFKITKRKALNSRVETFKFKNWRVCVDPTIFLELIKNKLINIVRDFLNKNPGLKCNIVLNCVFTRNQNSETLDGNFKTENIPIFKDENIESVIDSMYQKILAEIVDLNAKNSGWALSQITNLLARLSRYDPLKVGSYIPLPKIISNKKSTINVKNNDEHCFKYSILAKLVPKKIAHRVSSYDNLKHPYVFDEVPSVLSENNIRSFEKKNNISISLFALNSEHKVYPRRVSKIEKEDHRDLLILKNDSGKTHYVYITSLARLVHSQLTSDTSKILICKNCFTYFKCKHEQRFKLHLERCLSFKPAAVIMPEKLNNGEPPVLKFKNFKNTMKAPFVFYADTEAILKKKDTNSQDTLNITNEHIPMSIGYILKTDLEDRYCGGLNKKIQVFTGPTCIKQFLNSMVGNARKIDRLVHRVVPMSELTSAQKIAYAECTTCTICNSDIESCDVKVRDHCHISGQYRGAAHSACNLNFKIPKYIDVYFHNLAYDIHFLIKELDFSQGEIKVIANTEEKYIAVTKKIGGVELRFLDSFRFLSASLDSLAKLMPIEKLYTVRENFPEQKLFDLARRKGVYPYEYVNDFKILKEKKLPPKECFFSSLNNSNISDVDYSHALKVWHEFKIENMLEYTLLYLKIDIALLADIFQNFRNVCMGQYGLDPCHYFSLPGLSLDSALKHTGAEIELLTDYNIFLAFEKSIRGGCTQLVKKYSKSNNIFLNEKFDAQDESKYIYYLDANNLYGHAMCSPLPISNFRYVQPSEFSADSIVNMSDDAEYGYLFDVTILYPDHLHDEHNQLPFLCETKTPPGSKVPKLLATLSNKENYVVHYTALKQALQNGLLIEEIHSVIEFKQEAWVKPYILKNTLARSLSETDIEKAFYKLMNNSLFGKTIENKRLYRDIKLVCNKLKLQKLLNKPNFGNRIIYTENLVACHMAHEKIVMDKPIFVGSSILDISKVIMYDFFYSSLKPTFGERMNLLYMDTDSFIVEIMCHDLYQTLIDTKLSEKFDFSDYPVDHPCFSTENKKKLGFFKDEAGGRQISEFVGLRPKVYALNFEGQHHMRCKGVKKCNLGTKILFNDYLQCLRDKKVKYSSFYRIQSKLHVLYTVKQNKLSLSCNDDKRITMPDGINTLAYGHYRAQQLQIENGLLMNDVNQQMEIEEEEEEEEGEHFDFD